MDKVSRKCASDRLHVLLARLVPAVEVQGVIELTRYFLWLDSGAANAAHVMGTLGRVPVDKKKQAAADRRFKRFLQKAEGERWRAVWAQQKAVRRALSTRRLERGRDGQPWRVVNRLRSFVLVVRRRRSREAPDPNDELTREEWEMIAALLNECTGGPRWTAARLEAGWKLWQQRIEPWDAETLLYNACLVAPDLWSRTESFDFVISGVLRDLGYLSEETTDRLKKLETKRAEAAAREAAGPRELTEYVQAILQKIRRCWEVRVPAQTRRQAVIRFDIERDGCVRSATVEAGSGNPVYDEGARRAVLSAAPFWRLPDEHAAEVFTLRVSFKASTKTYTGLPEQQLQTLAGPLTVSPSE